MTKKPKGIVIIDKGSMRFESLKKGAVEFSLVSPKLLLSKRDRVFLSDSIPEDFDHGKYEISGAFHYTITIREK